MPELGNRMPAIAAHRGWHADGAHENSIVALERAKLAGVDQVEIDVRRLGDGTLVVHHDAVADGVPLEQLDRSLLDRKPHIPTLDAWVRRAGELDVHALVEVKKVGYERETVESLRRNLPANSFDLFSFEPDAVRALRELAPDRPVGQLSVDTAGSPAATGAELVARARQVGASFLGLEVAQATDPVLDAARRADLDVAVWTVNEPKDLARLLSDERVGTVITDMPATALKLRSALYGVANVELGKNLLRAASYLR